MNVLDAIRVELLQAALCERTVTSITVTTAALQGSVVCLPAWTEATVQAAAVVILHNRVCVLVHPRDWVELLTMARRDLASYDDVSLHSVFGVPVVR